MSFMLEQAIVDAQALKEAAIKLKILSEKDFNKIVVPKKMV